MGYHMFLEVISSFAEEITLCTAEICFSCMGQHVCLEGTGLCAGEVALFASTVNHNVSFQMIGLDG